MRKILLGMFAATLLCMAVYAGGDGEGKNTRPSDEEIKKLETVKLTAEVKDGNVELSWTPANGDGAGVKVVASESSKNPVYPQDGYVLWLPEKGQTKATVPNEKAGGEKAKCYRVCFVNMQDHGKLVAVSNVVELPAIALTDASKKALEEKAKKQAEEKEKKAAEKKDKEAKKDEKKAE